MRRLCEILALVLLILSATVCHAQLSGYVRAGVNFGTINQEWWPYGDSIKYGKVLIRPIIGIGGQYTLDRNWMLRQEIMFQIKGQGTVKPDVWSGFRTENPDILRFISFPFSVKRRLFSHLFVSTSIQPSLFLSGTDNYSSKENWKGWIWGYVLGLEYNKKALEIGAEYDIDFTQYYCPDCEIKFSTLRIYGAYHFQPE